MNAVREHLETLLAKQVRHPVHPRVEVMWGEPYDFTQCTMRVGTLMEVVAPEMVARRVVQPVTWEKHAKGLDEMLGKVLDERVWLQKQLDRFAPWRVFKINDYDWWLACTLEQACDGYRDEYGVDGIDVNPDDPPRVLTVEELDKLTFIDREKYDPMDPEQWECLCGCGERCTLADRWNGHAYEHSHGYPAGHCETRNVHKRTFAEELARRIAAGPRVELFASTEH